MILVLGRYTILEDHLALEVYRGMGYYSAHDYDLSKLNIWQPFKDSDEAYGLIYIQVYLPNLDAVEIEVPELTMDGVPFLIICSPTVFFPLKLLK